MYINNVLYCFYSSDTEAFEACFRLLHDDDDDDDDGVVYAAVSTDFKMAVPAGHTVQQSKLRSS